MYIEPRLGETLLKLLPFLIQLIGSTRLISTSDSKDDLNLI